MTNFDFLTSDQHYGHFNIIKYSNRPFAGLQDMHDTMITRYNAVVGSSDKVLFLGDVFFTKFAESYEILSSLNGKKYLLRGNHDKYFKDDQFLKMGFEEVYPKYFKSRISKYHVYYSHYPFEGYSADKRYPSRRPPNDGTTIVHGHTHDNTKLTCKGTIHIGVDGWDFSPAPMDAVDQLLKEMINA